jgi:hypothetical protein
MGQLSQKVSLILDLKKLHENYAAFFLFKDFFPPVFSPSNNFSGNTFACGVEFAMHSRLHVLLNIANQPIH